MTQHLATLTVQFDSDYPEDTYGKVTVTNGTETLASFAIHWYNDINTTTYQAAIAVEEEGWQVKAPLWTAVDSGQYTMPVVPS